MKELYVTMCVCGVKELCESGVCERVVSEGGV